ncbi:MAG: AAA family ATPase [Solirubrobacterales bacterium]
MKLVAISASYGAGGNVVGPALAERLGVPFLDRAIPVQVAERLEVPLADADAHDDRAGGSWLERTLRGFRATDPSVPAPLPAANFTSEDFRRATEEVLLRQAETGEGVVLGRASTIVLREDPRALRVRLDGPRERPIRQAMKLGGIDEETATRALEHLDRTHGDYARDLYGVEIAHPANFHLLLDSTAIPLEACVDLIALAAEKMPAGEATRSRPGAA